MIDRRRRWSIRPAHTALVASVAVAAVALAACGGSKSPSDADGATGKSYRVALLASSSQNGYNQAVFEGMQKKAAELGNVKVTILDGQFDAQVQFNQVQDAAASGKYDGIVIVPSDTVGIGAAIPDAKAKGIPVVTTLFPIGPDLTKLEPQVDGIISTVASPPAEGATKQADLVVDYCKDKNPCNVVLLIGQLQFPFDKLRYDSYKAVLSKHSNIKIVATAEGNYDRDTSLKAMTDVIQANKQIDVVLSNADQQTVGAAIALKNAGRDLSAMYVTGGGGTTEAVQAVRSGEWKEAYLNFPVSMGEAALEQVMNALTGKPVTAVVDADNIGPLAPFATKADLDAKPDFLGQWSG